MLEYVKQEDTKHSDVRDEIITLRSELASLEQEVKKANLPVIILFEGWSASGKGSMISEIIKNLDPRSFKVVVTRNPSENDKRKPWLWRFWQNIPEKTRFSIMDRSWYRDTANAYLYGEISRDEFMARLDDVNTMEKQLTDDGYLVVKYFLHISNGEQKKRLEKLEDNKLTSWRVDNHDMKNCNRYEKFYKQYDKMLTATNTEYAPWYCVPADDRTTGEFYIYCTLTNAIKAAIHGEKQDNSVPEHTDFSRREFKLIDMPSVKNQDMSKCTLTDEEYEKKLKKQQKKLAELQNKCYLQKRPVIICYEGWDAGGKGGNIRRVTAALDPRGYEVVPIAAPDKSEINRHYLWRFWRHIGNDGHFTIFDRTWYGRVMVEKIEGFTDEKRCEMAYQEIIEFERQLVDWGAVIVKFWINIDKDEQLARFTLRQNTPEKQWKITDEDWRNREKWDAYEIAVDEMIGKTSTNFAPWHIIEGNDKKYARIKALKTINEAISRTLDE